MSNRYYKDSYKTPPDTRNNYEKLGLDKQNLTIEQQRRVESSILEEYPTPLIVMAAKDFVFSGMAAKKFSLVSTNYLNRESLNSLTGGTGLNTGLLPSVDPFTVDEITETVAPNPLDEEPKVAPVYTFNPNVPSLADVTKTPSTDPDLVGTGFGNEQFVLMLVMLGIVLWVVVE